MCLHFLHGTRQMRQTEMCLNLFLIVEGQLLIHLQRHKFRLPFRLLNPRVDRFLFL